MPYWFAILIPFYSRRDIWTLLWPFLCGRPWDSVLVLQAFSAAKWGNHGVRLMLLLQVRYSNEVCLGVKLARIEIYCDGKFTINVEKIYLQKDRIEYVYFVSTWIQYIVLCFLTSFWHPLGHDGAELSASADLPSRSVIFPSSCLVSKSFKRLKGKEKTIGKEKEEGGPPLWGLSGYLLCNKLKARKLL